MKARLVTLVALAAAVTLTAVGAGPTQRNSGLRFHEGGATLRRPAQTQRNSGLRFR